MVVKVEKYYYVKNDVDKVLYKKIKSEGDIVFLKGVYYRRIISVSKDNVICVDDTNEVIKKPKEDIYFNFNIRKDSKLLEIANLDSEEIIRKEEFFNSEEYESLRKHAQTN